MPKVTVYNLKNEQVGELSLADAVFGVEPNEALFYDVVKAQLASRRSGTAMAKNRSAVSGSTKKIYKQKGTGRARHGSIGAPIFVGGGKAHGPVPRDYSYRPTQKMRASAIRGALSLKLKEGRLTVVDNFRLGEIKTKELQSVLGTLQVRKGSLIVDDRENRNLLLSARNLEAHDFLPPEGVNLYDLLRHEHVVLTKGAVAALEARLAPANKTSAGDTGRARSKRSERERATQKAKG